MTREKYQDQLNCVLRYHSIAQLMTHKLFKNYIKRNVDKKTWIYWVFLLDFVFLWFLFNNGKWLEKRKHSYREMINGNFLLKISSYIYQNFEIVCLFFYICYHLRRKLLFKLSMNCSIFVLCILHLVQCREKMFIPEGYVNEFNVL